ncbi:ATP synthase delta chain, chloroplastic-like [Musa acuminata AAA Group]|uniref:ATP synthase delta chain, chloroplastic-like n=1 Tax=Musa acuminata AAA Group TaxID=214697 RepID=UPI0031E114AF
MAAIPPSPVALRPATPSSAIVIPMSFSLHRLPSAPRRLCSLRLASPSFRGCCRGATGAVIMDTAASRYANALADVARSNGSLEASITDMEKVDRLFADPEVQSFFANPIVAPDRKAELVKEITASCELRPHTANFLNILIEMQRIDIVKEIAREFEACCNRMTNTEVAIVSSVVRLEPQDLAHIAQAVQRLTGAKNVRIKTVLDPSLIAGFTIRYGPSGSKFIDMSVKKQINDIASQLDFSFTSHSLD